MTFESQVSGHGVLSHRSFSGCLGIAEGKVMVDDLAVALEESLPSERELRERECRALRELDLVKRLLRVVRRRDEFRAADKHRQSRQPATVGG